jgi:steroid 5-alpha reductase family enzyme
MRGHTVILYSGSLVVACSGSDLQETEYKERHFFQKNPNKMEAFFPKISQKNGGPNAEDG